jgi:hypothetical protein
VDGDGLVEQDATTAEPVGALGIESIELEDEGGAATVELDPAVEGDARGAAAAEVAVFAGIAGRRRQ